MTPEQLAKFIHEALKPLQGDIKDLQSVFDDIVDSMSKMENLSSMTKQELKTYVVDRVSDTRLALMRDRDQFRGDPGPVGERGEKGVRGDPGTRGEKGDTGDRGDRGEKGDLGIQGAPGERGYPGKDGKDGPRGHTGKDGPVGKRGDTGPTGAVGERGSPGVDGKDGAPGERGFTGKKGERGDTGQQGVPGERGVPGRDGKDGQRGYRGEKGERGDDGKTGAKGENGEIGARGYVDAVEPWTKREYTARELVSKNGGTWQARRTTTQEPKWDSNSWELLANGLNVTSTDNHAIEITDSAGGVFSTGSLKGDKGDKGDCVEFHESYSETQEYRKSLDEVKESGGTWRAIKDGYLHCPGTANGKGQWKLISHPGKEGKPGKDADEERIEERLWQRWVLENQLRIETTVKQVEQYFNTMDLGFND